MSDGRRSTAIVGSLAFLVLVPGSVAGLVPWWLTGWQPHDPPRGGVALQVAGWALILTGVVSLLESFGQFAFAGHGTPAPPAPPTRLVVSGQYRHVRNPMYLAVLAIVAGQGLLLSRGVLVEYAALLLVAFHSFVVLYEEPALAARFGASYGEYRRNVRRWWPRLEPWAPPGLGRDRG